MDDKSVFIKRFGQNIRRVRVEKNMTIEKLALDAGVTYSQISRLELGKRNPTAYTIYVLSKTLNCCPSEFFFDHQEKQRPETV